MSSDDHKKVGEYLMVNPEKRGATRKDPEGEFSVTLDRQFSPRKILPQEICGSVINKSAEAASLVDVSESGMRIKCKMDLSPGQKVVLRFGIPTRESQPQRPLTIFATCQVIWQKKIAEDNSPQAGLKILEMSETQAARYIAFVANLPDSAKAHA